jgi:hypothetical protein
MSPKLRLLRTLRRWHSRVGFAAMLFFVLLAITGLVLNHSSALGLDARYVHASWLARWYGIRNELPRQAFRSAHHSLVAANGRWLLDGRITGEMLPSPVGLVELADILVVGAGAALYLYRTDGELLDRLENFALPGLPVQAIGANQGKLVVQTPAGNFTSADVLSWRPGPRQGVAWSRPAELSSDEGKLYAEKLAPGVAMQKLLLDLHSGRIIGRHGPLLFDLVAIVLAALSLSGAWLFLAPRLRREPR